MNGTPSATRSGGQAVKLFIGIGIGLFCLIGFLLVLDAFKLISLGNLFSKSKKTTLPVAQTVTMQQSASSNAIIAKVGEETLYQSDYAVEERYYPNIKSKTKQLLVNKMVKDSIILQAAQKDGLMTLDASFYNSSTKDYKKRLAKVQEVESLLEKKQNRIKGSIVSLWFYNNSKPTTMEAAAAKEFARAKITPLYNAVKNRQITMRQAGEQLKNDASLVAIDVAYKSNAYMDFAALPDERISFDPQFDSAIRQLQPGQLSQLTLIQDKELKTKNLRDAIYMFAQVTEKKQDGITQSFANWYAAHEKKYEVTRY